MLVRLVRENRRGLPFKDVALFLPLGAASPLPACSSTIPSPLPPLPPPLPSPLPSPLDATPSPDSGAAEATALRDLMVSLAILAAIMPSSVGATAAADGDRGRGCDGGD